jgi:hypothetical protein
LRVGSRAEGCIGLASRGVGARRLRLLARWRVGVDGTGQWGLRALPAASGVRWVRVVRDTVRAHALRELEVGGLLRGGFGRHAAARQQVLARLHGGLKRRGLRVESSAGADVNAAAHARVGEARHPVRALQTENARKSGWAEPPATALEVLEHPHAAITAVQLTAARPWLDGGRSALRRMEPVHSRRCTGPRVTPP